MYGETIKI